MVIAVKLVNCIYIILQLLKACKTANCKASRQDGETSEKGTNTNDWNMILMNFCIVAVI